MMRNGNSKSLEPNPSDDICPVCKSNRYLTPSLQFLINTECYHKMCSTCVDRIFNSGPASCPVPYCGKTLRKKGFHKAFFGDLKVERECDIRKRVGAVFNKRQDEFETLMDWNNYLEEVESLIFDLVEGGKEDKMRAEERLRAYRDSNAREIEENKRAGLEEVELGRRRERAELEAARQRRLNAQREALEEKMDAEKSRKEVLEQLASGDGDAKEITEMAQRIVLKKSGARRIANEAILQSSKDPSLTIRGLKKKIAPVSEKPYDPFGGVDLTPTQYILQDEYESEWLASAKRDPKHTAGGYSFNEYYERTMFEAFSGLVVFIEEEVGHRPPPAAPSNIATVAAAAEASRVKIKAESRMDIDDDVFS